jgi:hypothetical protein
VNIFKEEKKMKKIEKTEIKKKVWRDILFVLAWWLFAACLDSNQWASDFVDYLDDILYEVFYPLHVSGAVSEWASIMLAFSMLTALLSFSFNYITYFAKKLFNK